MKKKYVYLWMIAAAFASCAENEVVDPFEPTDVELELRSEVRNITASSSTRAAYEGTDLTANPITALVLATATSFDYSSLYCNGTMTFNGSGNISYNKPVTAGTYTMPAAATIYLSGLHPGTGWNVATAPTFDLTGKDDVMFAGEENTSISDMTSGTFATLKFNHQLTLLKVSFLGDDKAVDYKVNSIELVKVNEGGIPAKVTANLGSPQSITFSGAEGSLPCYVKDSDDPYTGIDYVLTSTASEQAYVLAPPVTAVAGNKEYTFKIHYIDQTDGPKYMDVNVDLKVSAGTPYTGSTVGKAFDITFKFIGGQIEALATVTDWVTGGTFTEEI